MTILEQLDAILEKSIDSSSTIPEKIKAINSVMGTKIKQHDMSDDDIKKMFAFVVATLKATTLY